MPKLSRSEIIEHTGRTYFARGEDYFRSGYVSNVKFQNNSIAGKVHGNRFYSTKIFLSENGIADSRCSCPMNFACKHVAALGLAAIALATDDDLVIDGEIIGGSPTTDPIAEPPLDENRVRRALEDLGLPGNSISRDIIVQLLRYQDTLSTVVPTPEKIAPIKQAETKPFNPKDYYIALSRYDNYKPTFHEKKFSYQTASIDNVLTRVDLSPEQRELFTYIKDGRFDHYDSPPPDLKRLFKLLADSEMLVCDIGYSYNNRLLKIDIDPKERLRAEITHNPADLYYDGLKIRHDFFFKLSKEYWNNTVDYQQEKPIYVGNDYIILQKSSALELHHITPLLGQIINRVEPYYSYEKTRRQIQNCQTQLTGTEIARWDEIYNDASKYLDITNSLPVFSTQKSDKFQPSILVDYDTKNQTLRISPIIDYGVAMVDISESVFLSRTAVGNKLLRRAPNNHTNTHLITIAGSDLRYALTDSKKEIQFYQELSESFLKLGFTKTLKCQRRGEKQIFEYLNLFWPALSEYANKSKLPVIFAKDELALKQGSMRAEFNIDINADNNWLYFDAQCYLGDDRVTLAKLAEFLESGSPFWQKNNGDLITITNRTELERLVRLLQSFNERENGGFEGKLYHAPELEYVITSSTHYNTIHNESLNNFISEIKNGRPIKKIKLPARFYKLLRPYQRAGVDWLYFLRSYHFAGILADDMGLGKTLQTLVILSLERSPNKPSIIVCPKTLLFNWKFEASKFTPELKVLVIDGSPKERVKALKHIKNYDLIVISYSTLKQDEDKFAKLFFNYAILDEAQFVKNHRSKSAQMVKKLNADYRLALTGTPLENSVSEVWSIFDFLMPGFLGNFEQFSKQFHRPIMDTGDREALLHLRRKVEHFMLRRAKSEVLKELPAKIEQLSQCQLSEAQNILYQQILAKVRGDVFTAVAEKGFKNAQIHILAGLTKLRQACNHPALLTKDADWKKYESAKLDMCLELVDEVREGKRKVLIFSQFTTMLDIVAEALKERGVEYNYLSGKTKNRQELVETFNSDQNITVFLISLKAGGTGLNLTSADTVIIFDPWWNPSVENQAVDRAHRIGQTKAVNVYRLLTTGTIEEKIQALKQKKQNLFDALISESGNLFKKLTWDDVRDLFAM